MRDHPPLPGIDTAARAYQSALDDILHITLVSDDVRSHLDRCPRFVHGQLLLVLLALAEEDFGDATHRLNGVADRCAAMPRRQRQLVEIVGLAVRNERYRFQALIAVHLAEHPDDHGLLVAAEIALAHTPRPTP